MRDAALVDPLRHGVDLLERLGREQQPLKARSGQCAEILERGFEQDAP